MCSVKSCINFESSLSLGHSLHIKALRCPIPLFLLLLYLCLEVYPNYSLPACIFFPSNSSQSSSQKDSYRLTLLKPLLWLSTSLKAKDLKLLTWPCEMCSCLCISDLSQYHFLFTHVAPASPPLLLLEQKHIRQSLPGVFALHSASFWNTLPYFLTCPHGLFFYIIDVCPCLKANFSMRSTLTLLLKTETCHSSTSSPLTLLSLLLWPYKLLANYVFYLFILFMSASFTKMWVTWGQGFHLFGSLLYALSIEY